MVEALREVNQGWGKPSKRPKSATWNLERAKGLMTCMGMKESSVRWWLETESQKRSI